MKPSFLFSKAKSALPKSKDQKGKYSLSFPDYCVDVDLYSLKWQQFKMWLVCIAMFYECKIHTGFYIFIVLKNVDYVTDDFL